MYIQTALDHMRKYGVKLNFSSQGKYANDLLVLKYIIHIYVFKLIKVWSHKIAVRFCSQWPSDFTLWCAFYKNHIMWTQKCNVEKSNRNIVYKSIGILFPLLIVWWESYHENGKENWKSHQSWMESRTVLTLGHLTYLCHRCRIVLKSDGKSYRMTAP